MLTFLTVRPWLFAAVLTLMTLISAPTKSRIVGRSVATVSAIPVSAAENSTFFTVRQDLRKCASPMCGGYFITRVNQAVTRCANGRDMAECYVTDIDWNGAAEVEPRQALIRGSLVTRGDQRGKYGVLRVTEVWQAGNSEKATGEFFRVKDLGVRCIAAPCQTHLEAKLNTSIERKIAGIALASPTEGSDEWIQALKAMTSEEGVIVVGQHADVSGPAGRSQMLKATQFFVRKSSTAGALKPCIKTGCSQEICSDQEVISTCEYRKEYECYKKATCERQADGNCGWTKTPELDSCLRGKG